MYCPNCGTKAVENAKFCMECGTKLTVPQTDEPKIELPSPLPKWLEGMPPRLQMVNWLGEKYEKYQEGLELAKEEMREHPSLDALSSIFSCYLALKQFDRAQQTLNELKSFGATQVSLDLYQALMLLYKEKHKEAEPLLERLMIYRKDLPSKNEAILLLFGLAVVQRILEKDNLEVLDEIIKLKEYCAPTALKTTYYIRGCVYFQKEQHNQAYLDFVSAQKEGFTPNLEFCYLRAISGFSCGQLEYIQEDINFVLNSNVDEDTKKIVRDIQEKLANKETDTKKTDIVITDEVMKESYNMFYEELLKAIEKYQTEKDVHTSLNTFSSENLKLLMKHSLRYTFNYWEEVFSSVMTPQLQADFTAAKKEVKHYVDENFNRITERANFLIDDVIEQYPEDSLWENGKNILKGALTGYFGGWLGVLGLMSDQAEENKTMNKTFNKWDTYLKQMMKEYDDVYSFFIEHIDKLIKRHHIPIELSDENEDDD